MRIDWWTLAIQTVNVLVLIWLLSRFLYRPVMAAIAARQAAVRTLLSNADEAKRQADSQSAAIEKRFQSFEADKARLQQQARAEAEEQRKRMLEAAAKEAAAARASAEAALRCESDLARKALERDAALLSVDIAQKLLSRAAADAVVEAFFEGLLRMLPNLPDNECKGLKGSLELVCALPASTGAQEHFRSALSAVLPEATSIMFTVDPELICGFELRGPGVVVSNNWRTDLREVSDDLASQGHA